MKRISLLEGKTKVGGRSYTYYFGMGRTLIPIISHYAKVNCFT